MNLIEQYCTVCFAPFLGRRSYRKNRSIYCSDCLEVFTGNTGKDFVEYPKFEWHNVKPTPPGTVKMLTQMSEEIERYMQAVKRD